MAEALVDSEARGSTDGAKWHECYGCVVVAQLAVQAGVRLRTHLAHSAVAVVVMEGKRPLERVCSLNGVAKRIGLAEGMSRVEVETFQGVHVLARSVAEEDQARSVLVEAMGAFSPRVEPRVSGGDWECVLDLMGTERLMGDGAAVGRRIVLRMEELGFAGAVVVAGNVDAGLLLGREMAWSVSITSGLLPSRITGHPGVLVVPKGDESKALAGLSLGVLKLDTEIAERFAIWGIGTLEELAALPETALIARMGQTGKKLRLRARGELPHLLEPAVEEFRLEETLELEQAVDTLEPLLFVLNPMLEQLCIRAMGRALAIAAVTVELGLEHEVVTAKTYTGISDLAGNNHGNRDIDSFSRTVRPGLPTLDRKLLLKMLQLDLEVHPSAAAVRRVTLRAEAGKTSRVQLGLFMTPMPEPTRFEDTHARLLSVVGEGNVGRVRPLDTHAAEGFVLERFCLPGGDYKAHAVREVGMRLATVLRRMRPPVEVHVEMRGAEIRRFWLKPRWFEVLRCFGPWRSSGDWWCGQVWSVDSWDVAARDGDGELLLCLVGHDLVKQVWVLEGIYD